jgi:hypothetical protein
MCKFCMQVVHSGTTQLYWNPNVVFLNALPFVKEKNKIDNVMWLKWRTRNQIPYPLPDNCVAALFHVAPLDNYAVTILPFFRLHPSCTLLPPNFAKWICSSQTGLSHACLAPLFDPIVFDGFVLCTLHPHVWLDFVLCAWHSCLIWLCPMRVTLVFDPTFDSFLLRALHPCSTQLLTVLSYVRCTFIWPDFLLCMLHPCST